MSGLMPASEFGLDATLAPPELILASASPRRKQLLEQLGVVATICSTDIDETPQEGELAADYVRRLASCKAETVALLNPNAIVLGADTIIALEGNLLGKPLSKQHAFDMWNMMSGKWHQVLTGVSVFANGESRTVLNSNDVLFCELSEKSMQTYWESGEPADKAGAYAIQGYAARWIKEIRGSYSGIMGLPLYETAELLKEAGMSI